MPIPLRVVLWKANGLSNHKLELQAFLDMHKIDIALISGTHFTSRTVFKIPHYTVYHTTHPDDTAHGVAAVILRSSIRHHELLPHQSDKIQAATVQLDAHPWPLTISAIYCLPRQAISTDDYDNLPIPGNSVPDWRGMERETYCVGSTAYHTEGKEPPPRYLQPQLSLFQHWRTHTLADGPH